VYWKDRAGRYMGCNKFVATMAGYPSPEDMIGKTDYDFCWNEFADEWQLLDNKVITEDTTIKREEKPNWQTAK
jgi:PAS domain-containing protein